MHLVNMHFSEHAPGQLERTSYAAKMKVKEAVVRETKSVNHIRKSSISFHP